jgi:hypothetical protein
VTTATVTGVPLASLLACVGVVIDQGFRREQVVAGGAMASLSACVGGVVTAVPPGR